MSSHTNNLMASEALTPRANTTIIDLIDGYEDPVTGTLHKSVTLRAMNGVQEDLLSNSGILFWKRCDGIFAQCVTALGTLEPLRISQAIPFLTMPDRATILIALRNLTLGSKYPMEEECPHCEDSYTYVVDISKLGHFLGEGEGRTRISKLPSGRVATWHILQGSDLDKHAKYKPHKLGRKSMAIMIRLDEIDGEPVTPRMVRNMHGGDRDALRAQFMIQETAMDMTVKIACKGEACGLEFERDIEVNSYSFFSPLEVLAFSKRKRSTSVTP